MAEQEKLAADLSEDQKQRLEEFIEEALQTLRARLLVGPRAKIADYAARGTLVAWLSVAAARVALDAIRSRNARKLHHARFRFADVIHATLSFFCGPQSHVTGDHLRRGETRSKAAHDLPERTIGDSSHRSEHD